MHQAEPRRFQTETVGQPGGVRLEGFSSPGVPPRHCGLSAFQGFEDREAYDFAGGELVFCRIVSAVHQPDQGVDVRAVFVGEPHVQNSAGHLLGHLRKRCPAEAGHLLGGIPL